MEFTFDIGELGTIFIALVLIGFYIGWYAAKRQLEPQIKFYRDRWWDEMAKAARR